MMEEERSPEERQKDRERKYDQDMAQARIERAVMRYERLISMPSIIQGRKTAKQ